MVLYIERDGQWILVIITKIDMQKLLQLKQCQSTSVPFGTVCLAGKCTNKFDKFDLVKEKLFIHKIQPSITTQRKSIHTKV